ncbi:hypothetical protein CASFOL_016960 [Castilleja foliolosa]|uniref:Uncharacterized protein n=1 Tax=Castilleja foliolosa TaxID=1961234 RepID=A0ABD3DA63_9LAMI
MVDFRVSCRWGCVCKVVLRLGLIKPYYRLKSALKKPMGRDSGSNSGSRGSYRYATVFLIICQSAFSGSEGSYRYATVILIIWKFSLAVARVATAILSEGNDEELVFDSICAPMALLAQLEIVVWPKSLFSSKPILLLVALLQPLKGYAKPKGFGSVDSKIGSRGGTEGSSRWVTAGVGSRGWCPEGLEFEHGICSLSTCRLQSFSV